MPKGIRVMRGKVQIRYAVRGVRYEESLNLPATEAGIARAVEIRWVRQQTKMKGISPVITGIGLSEVNSAIRVAFASARKRGGNAYLLTHDQEQHIVTRSRGCCELTGVSFSTHREANWSRAPFSPSVDRIRSAEGYTFDNTRLVCVAANFAMNQWGEEVLRIIAEGYIASGRGAFWDDARLEGAL